MKLATRTFKRKDWYITCPFGERINPVTHKKDFHSGCDYGTNREKWKQYALEEGKVTRVGYNAKGYGHYLDIQYPRLNIQLFYAHLDKVYVKKGEKVTENTCIGLTGTTGMSTGIHLHLGFKKIGGEYQDPEKYDYIPPEEPPKPTYKYKVGTKVKIIATGNSNANGTGKKAGGIGWIRYVTKIHEGKPYPYQVGNKGSTASKDTTGFYKESALKEV